MKQWMAGVVLACMAAVPAFAAGGDAKTAQLLKDVDFCYGVSALAASTVQLRNQGQAQEALLERRKATLAEGDYALIADITAQVYAKDLRDPFRVAGDTNAACLEAKGHARAFARAGQQQCPKVGLMKSEVDAMRRGGSSAEDTIAALKERYAGTRTALGETLEVVAGAKLGDAPDSGAFENQMCMILAITGR